MTTNPIRLAIDLDGVLTEQPAPLARAANDHFGLDLPDTAFVDSASLNISQAVCQWVYSVDGPAADLAAADDAGTFLSSTVDILGADNVFIVTARPAQSREMTEDWLQRHDLDHCEVVFADDKVKAASRLGINFAIEDSIRHARAYQEAGITALLLNNEQAKEPPGVEHPIPDLQAATGYLEKARKSMGNSEQWTIVISDVIDADARDALRRSAAIVDVAGTDRAAVKQALRNADALIVRSETRVDQELIEAGSRLQVIARAGVGTDNIDIDAATRAGILVLNTPGANSISAGEHTIAMLLALIRQLPAANASVHAGRWQRKEFDLFDIAGKTVGIVGLGRVGTVVAERLRAFVATVIAHDPHIPPERFANAGVEQVDYLELLGSSDVVTYHCPLTEATYHYLSAENIGALKPGAIVINCARGNVIDHEALAAALDDGRVSGAAVDVYPEEPLVSSPLQGRPNVVLTPHLGGSSREAMAKVGEIIQRTVIAALRGESVANAVNLPVASIDTGTMRRLTRSAEAAGTLLSVLEAETPAAFTMTIWGQVSEGVRDLVYNAALAEALRKWTNRRVTPVNSRIVAAEAGINLRMTQHQSASTSLSEFFFEAERESSHYVAMRWENGDAGIYEVDHFSLGQPLAGQMLITHHHDRPGMVGQIGSALGESDINIAGMQLSRLRRGGDAIMVLNVDEPIEPALLERIRNLDEVQNAYVVSLPESESV